MTDLTTIQHTAKEPRLYGVIDVLRADRVAGWVIDRTDSARSATVEVRREDRLIGTVIADRPRKDLERKGVGTGSYGFAFSFDPPLEEGMEFTVAITAKSHDGVELRLQPAARAAKLISAEQKVLGRVLSELGQLRLDIVSMRQELATAEGSRTQFYERLEIVQLRLESCLPATTSVRQDSSRWLAGIAIAGAVVAVGSLAIGILSLWTA